MAADEDALAREKFELDKKRFELDQETSRLNQRFWHRNFGTMTTFAIAFLGLALSIAQVWVAYVQKDRESLEKEHEIALAQIEKDRELQSQDRRDLRDFVTKNDSLIFSPDTAARDRMRKLMLSTFPADVVQPVFDSLFAISDPGQQATWAQARGEAADLVIKQSAAMVYVQYQGQGDAEIAAGVVKALADAGYRAPGKQMVTQKTNGDVRFFHSEEKDQAAHIAGLVEDFLKKHGRDQSLTPLFAGKNFPNVPANLFEVWIPAGKPQP